MISHDFPRHIFFIPQQNPPNLDLSGRNLAVVFFFGGNVMGRFPNIKRLESFISGYGSGNHGNTMISIISWL